MKNKLFTLTFLFGFMNAQNNLALEGALALSLAANIHQARPSEYNTRLFAGFAGFIANRHLAALTPMIEKNFPSLLAVCANAELRQSQISGFIGNNANLSDQSADLMAKLIVIATIFGAGKIADYVKSKAEKDYPIFTKYSGAKLGLSFASDVTKILSAFLVGSLFV
jgi:hypothetical protein